MLSAPDSALAGGITSEESIRTHEHLLRPAQTALCALAAMNVLFSVADLHLSAEILPTLTFVNALLLAVVLTALWVIGKRRSDAAVRNVLIVTHGLVCFLIAATGILIDDPARAAFYCLAITWGAALMIPWTVTAQLTLAMAAGVALVVAPLLLGDLSSIAAYPALATGLALAASGVLALQFERQRQAFVRETLRRTEAVRASLERSVAERTAQLHDSQRRFQIASELASDYAYAMRVEEDGSFTMEWLTEASFLRITGFNLAEERTPEYRRSIIYRDDQQLVRERMQRLLAGAGDTLEFRIVTKSGEVRWIQDSSKPEWDEAHQRVVRIYGAVRDISERKAAEEILRERAQMSTLGKAVGAALTQNDTLPIMLQRCAKAIVIHLDAAFARIWTVNADNVLELQASAGLYTHLDGAHSRVPVGALKIGRIAAERKPHLTNDVCNDPRVSDQEWARREGMVAFAGYPLVVEDQLVGVVALFARHALAEFTLQLLSSVANEIAVGIERRRAEDALQRAQQQLTHILSASPVVLYSLKIQAGQATPVWNTGNITRLTGYAHNETLTLSWWIEHVHPDDLARAGAILVGEENRVDEYRFRRADGTYVWMRDEKRILRDAAGEAIEVVGSWSDITERKQAEQAVQQMQEQLARVLSLSPAVIYSLRIDRVGLIPVWISDNITQLSGYTCAEALSPTWWIEHVHPDDLSGLGTPEAALAAGETLNEYRFRRADGSYVWIRDQARILRNAKGRPAEVVGSWIDISASKQAEQAIQQAQEELARVLSLSPVVIYSLRIEDGAVSVWASANIARITGYPYAETLSLAFWSEHIHPEDQSAFSSFAARLDQEQVTHDFRFRYADGSYAWIHDEARILRNLHGSPSEIVGAWVDVSEQKRAQAAARRGERRFRALIERSQDLVSIHHRDGTYRYANPAHEAVFGCTPEELIGKNAFDRMHPADVEALLPVLVEAVESHSPAATVEYRLRHQDGSWRSFEGLALNFLDDPEIAGVLITSRDITERKRGAERTALLQFAQDISGIYDLDTLLDRIQRRTAHALPCDWVATFYWQPKEEAFRVIADCGLPEAIGAAMRALKFGASEPFGGRLIQGETIIVNDFREAPASVAAIAETFGITALIAAPLHIQGRHLGSLAAFRTHAGEPFEQHQADLCTAIAGQLIIAIEALTLQQKQNQEALLSAALARVGQELISSLGTEQLLERLCAVTTGVLACDVSFTIVYSPEDRAYKLAASHGIPREESEAVRALTLPPEAVATLLAHLSETAVLQIDTANAPSLWAAIPARYGIGTVLYAALRRGDEIIGIHAAGFRDTAQHFDEAQERIAKGIAELASFGLQNARLLQQLESANRLKSEFLATMSHELLTPLNVIIGYSDLLSEEALGALNPDQAEGLERVRVNARQLLHLIGETLDLSRLEAGHTSIEISGVDVGALVQQVDLETRDVQEQSELQFVWNAPRGLLRIKTDPLKLRVVLKNLIGNAAKFTEHGGVTVTAQSLNNGVEISIADSGIGISAETLPIIFDPFRQGDSSFTRRHDGVGLGLHIVRRLVEILGGVVSVESELGRGSTFRVWLPQSGPGGNAELVQLAPAPPVGA